PYERRDRDAVRRICCDTGLWGNPIEMLFNDREIFADLFTSPYLNYEPEWALVAEDEGRIVGYLLGSICPNFDFTLMRSGFQTTIKMLGRFAAGRYARHPRSRRFIRWLLTAGFWEQPKHPASAAHLHVDIEKSHRGQGIGRLLWQTYEKKLRAAGIRQCYGAFFSHPKRQPELAYSRFGFSVFDRKRTTLFEPEISDPIEVVCVQKILQPVLTVNGCNGHNGHR
ncbi:MAG: GNAT family N-acetyltransferase, partial [Limisphaerales bacterium]